MQQRFLTVFNQLNHQNNPPLPKGLWLIHGDEELLHQWLIDACKPYWQNQNQTIKRMELSSAKSWYDVLTELNDLSLFGDSTAVVVSGNHKPDNKVLPQLEKFAKDVADGQSDNHLLWCLQKQDKKSLTTKALKLFDSTGLIVDGNIYNEESRTEILKAQSQDFAYSLDDNAWQMLLSHTEHNLLSAYQALWRLSFLYDDNRVLGVDELTQSLVDDADFTVFHLSDAVLMGDVQKSCTILSHLKHTDVAPSVVLWALAKDARIILQMQSGKTAESLGVWRNKVYAYENTAKRTYGQSADWLEKLYDIDKSIKGLGTSDVWQQFVHLVLAMCGTRLYSLQ